MDETPSNSASHPDPSCSTLRQHFHQLSATLNHFENLADKKFADDNLFRLLRVNGYFVIIQNIERIVAVDVFMGDVAWVEQEVYSRAVVSLGHEKFFEKPLIRHIRNSIDFDHATYQKQVNHTLPPLSSVLPCINILFLIRQDFRYLREHPPVGFGENMIQKRKYRITRAPHAEANARLLSLCHKLLTLL